MNSKKRPASKRLCPACGARAGVPIIYGMPLFEDGEAEKRGELWLGGCVILDPDTDPDRHCTSCEHEWRTRPGPGRPVGE